MGPETRQDYPDFYETRNQKAKARAIQNDERNSIARQIRGLARFLPDPNQEILLIPVGK
jgi:hypothetical protein